MAKWEYLILEIKKTSSRCELLNTNEVNIDEETWKEVYTGTGFNLLLYLNRMGAVGWELAGCHLSDGVSFMRNYSIFLLYLKRAVEDLASQPDGQG